MKWSLRLGRFAGIEVYLHFTFLLFLGFIAFMSAAAQRSLAGAVEGAGFFLAVFGCVLLHEFGHALTARRFGVATRDITLLPIGGVARLERLPDKPIEEFWVAIAGPAVNVVIAGLLFLMLLARGALVPEHLFSLMQGSFLQRLLAANVILVLFNLLPAFPMDGGRILRALLALRMEYARATQIAATLGQGMALVFAAVGLFVWFNPVLVFVAFFVWIGASQETSAAQVRSTLGGARVADAMLTQYTALAPSDPLARAVAVILAGSQTDFPVMEDGRFVGLLSRQRIISALAEQGRMASVASVMETRFTSATLDEPLEHALGRLRTGEAPLLPVLADGRLVGLLTPENVSEFVLIRSALRRAESLPAVPPVLPMR
ncbi:MAG: site-2 protease family protein [Limisphaerales bacterium]